MKRPLVLIEWVDSHCRRGWNSLDEIADAEPLHCRSVGWMVARKNGTVALASSISGEKNGNLALFGCGDITIPAKCIVKTTVLSETVRRGKVRPW